MKYNVQMSATLRVTIETTVEASDKKEAGEVAIKEVRNGEIDMTALSEVCCYGVELDGIEEIPEPSKPYYMIPTAI